MKCFNTEQTLAFLKTIKNFESPLIWLYVMLFLKGNYRRNYASHEGIYQGIEVTMLQDVGAKTQQGNTGTCCVCKLVESLGRLVDITLKQYNLSPLSYSN